MTGRTSHSEAEGVCLVVALGERAFQALRPFGARTHRDWTSAAIGKGGAVAKADRTLSLPTAIDQWFDFAFETLQEVGGRWPFALLLVDRTDPEAVELSDLFAIAAHGLGCAVGSVWFGPGELPPENFALAPVLRLRLRESATEQEAQDVVGGLLSAFEGCALPIDLESLAATWRLIKDGTVAAWRGSRSGHRDLARQLKQAGIRRPLLVHVYGGMNLRFSDLDLVRPIVREGCHCSLYIDEYLLPGAIVVVAVAPRQPRRPAVGANR